MSADVTESYSWCVQCERVHRNSSWRRGRSFGGSWRQATLRCPACGAGCGDERDWKQIAEANGYPAVPDEGAVYPQCGSVQSGEAVA